MDYTLIEVKESCEYKCNRCCLCCSCCCRDGVIAYTSLIIVFMILGIIGIIIGALYIFKGL